ncbi:hypothetical protein ACED96_14985 [Clostridium thermobutyricum]|uniref:Uncharacterized protein n=1 Tax=Clostridium thermobutyricum DSM 4928 TaxID=1121339 RepID=A0A1V4SY06_9CLOT|nr:hypothetical protein [Clostridium thermobutyricum]OPX48405.1 hypothetical protein CLTHE_12280 [Clostridium thermobutyricum DSM 4928]
MSNYIMNVKKELTKDEYGNIHDYLGVIDVNDNFTMNIENKNLINLDMINQIFEENNFVKIKEQINENGSCIIEANKVY